MSSSSVLASSDEQATVKAVRKAQRRDGVKAGSTVLPIARGQRTRSAPVAVSTYVVSAVTGNPIATSVEVRYGPRQYIPREPKRTARGVSVFLVEDGACPLEEQAHRPLGRGAEVEYSGPARRLTKNERRKLRRARAAAEQAAAE